MMRNDKKSNKIRNLIEKLPVCTLENLKILNLREEYLRIFLSREERSGMIVRLKKGFIPQKILLKRQKAKTNIVIF